MAKNKKKKSTQTKLPPMPTKPVAPTHVPRGKLTPGDKRFLGRQRGQLAEARKAGEEAASAQIRGISANLGRQGKKLSKESAKILGSMDRHVKQVKQENRQTRRDIRTGQQEILGRTSAAGAKGTWMEAGLTEARQRQAASQAKVSGQVASALQKQGQGVARAGKKAIQEYKAVEKTGTKNSMSILEVLAAERQSDDQRFLSEMRFNMRQQRQQEQFQLMMANLGFEQDIYKMQLQNRLQAEYLDWQHENGFLMKPEEQAALDWKYEKKALSYAYRQSQKDNDKTAATKWDSYNTQITDTITRLNTQLSDPEKWNAVLSKAKERASAGEYPSMRDALIDGLAPVQDDLPRGVDAGIIQNVVSDMVDNRISGDRGTPEAGGPGWAPNFEQVTDYIRQADEDGSLSSYIKRKSNVINQAHQDYKQIAAAAEFVNARRDETLTDGSWGALGKVAAGVAAVGATGVVGRKVLSNPEGAFAGAKEGVGDIARGAKGVAGRGARAVGDVARRVAGPDFSGMSVNVTEADLLQSNKWSKPASAAVKAAAQRGRTSMFGNPDFAVATRIEHLDNALRQGAITAAEHAQHVGIVRRAIGSAFTVGDEGLGLLRHADPELYQQIVQQLTITPYQETEAVDINLDVGA